MLREIKDELRDEVQKIIDVGDIFYYDSHSDILEISNKRTVITITNRFIFINDDDRYRDGVDSKIKISDLNSMYLEKESEFFAEKILLCIKDVIKHRTTTLY